MRGKLQIEPCSAVAAIERDLSIDLPGQNPDDPKSQRLGILPVEILGNAHAIIPAGEPKAARLKPREKDGDLAAATARKRVFESVGKQLIQDQTAGNCAVHRQV